MELWKKGRNTAKLEGRNTKEKQKESIMGSKTAKIIRKGKTSGDQELNLEPPSLVYAVNSKYK
jgi:hypothetical protein